MGGEKVNRDEIGKWKRKTKKIMGLGDKMG